MNYYNEYDPKAAAWLRELIAQGHIPKGIVDERSITEIQPHELEGFTQCHFFAGIGGWSLALQLAGWPEDKSVWTGSCPCQPFSAAGKQLAQADKRHLWPDFFNLIRKCRPERVFGEQVANAIGKGWLDGISADLESEGYACGAAVLGAHSVGAPHLRQRLYWVANSSRGQCEQRIRSQRDELLGPAHCGTVGRLGLADRVGSEAGISGPLQRKEGNSGIPDHAGHQTDPRERERERERETVWLVHTQRQRLEGHTRNEDDRNQSGWLIAESDRSASEAGHVSFWSKCILLQCSDGKTRRTEPSIFPLADGIPGRVALLRGTGNAIVPQTAAVFIETFTEITTNTHHYGQPQ